MNEYERFLTTKLLESPDIFPDLHDRLINGISDAIDQQLPPPYYSAIASRVYVEHSISLRSSV